VTLRRHALAEPSQVGSDADLAFCYGGLKWYLAVR